MKRYYLSRIVGNGTRGDMWRSRADDLARAAGGSCTAVIPAAPVANGWCLAAVNVVDHTSLLADAGVVDLPDLTLDAQLNTISATLRNRLLTALQTAGVDTTGITNTTAFRLAVRRAGQRFDAAFSENNFDAV